MKETELLRNRDFRLVAGSVGLSALGDWVAIVALGLQVKEMTDSGFAVAGLWICLFGPSVAVAAHAGLLVDRFEATRLLATVSLLGAAVAAALGFTTTTTTLLALTALVGFALAVSQPAEFALVPLLAAGAMSRRLTATSRRLATSGSASVPFWGASSSRRVDSSWRCSLMQRHSRRSVARRFRYMCAATRPNWQRAIDAAGAGMGSHTCSATGSSHWSWPSPLRPFCSCRRSGSANCSSYRMCSTGAASATG